MMASPPTTRIVILARKSKLRPDDVIDNTFYQEFISSFQEEHRRPQQSHGDDQWILVDPRVLQGEGKTFESLNALVDQPEFMEFLRDVHQAIEQSLLRGLAGALLLVCFYEPDDLLSMLLPPLLKRCLSWSSPEVTFEDEMGLLRTSLFCELLLDQMHRQWLFVSQGDSETVEEAPVTMQTDVSVESGALTILEATDSDVLEFPEELSPQEDVEVVVVEEIASEGHGSAPDDVRDAMDSESFPEAAEELFWRACSEVSPDILEAVASEVLVRIYNVFDPAKGEGSGHISHLLKKYSDKLPGLIAKVGAKYTLSLWKVFDLFKHVHNRIRGRVSSGVRSPPTGASSTKEKVTLLPNQRKSPTYERDIHRPLRTNVRKASYFQKFRNQQWRRDVSNFRPEAYEERIATWKLGGYSWVKDKPAQQSLRSPELLQAGSAKAWLHYFPAGNTTLAYDSGFSSIALQVDPTFSKQLQMGFTVVLKSQVDGVDDVVVAVLNSLTLEDQILKLNGTSMENNMIPFWNFVQRQALPSYLWKDDSLFFQVSFKFWRMKSMTSFNTRRPSGAVSERILQLANAEGDGKQLSEVMRVLLDSRRHSDVVLCVGGEVLEAHRLILATWSPVFERMLFPSNGHGHLEATLGRVMIEDTDSGVAKAFLRTLYTDKIPEEVWLDEEMLCNLLAMFHKYEVRPLVTKCEKQLASQLSSRTVCDRFMMADLLELPFLRRSALQFMTESTRRLAEAQATDGFQRLTHHRPGMLAEILGELAPPVKRLRSDRLN